MLNTPFQSWGKEFDLSSRNVQGQANAAIATAQNIEFIGSICSLLATSLPSTSKTMTEFPGPEVGRLLCEIVQGRALITWAAMFAVPRASC